MASLNKLTLDCKFEFEGDLCCCEPCLDEDLVWKVNYFKITYTFLSP